MTSVLARLSGGGRLHAVPALIVLAAGVGCLILLGALQAEQQAARERAAQAGLHHVEMVAGVLARQVEAVLRGLDLSLALLANEHFHEPPPAGDGMPRDAHSIVAGLGGGQMAQLWVVGGDGRVLFASDPAMPVPDWNSIDAYRRQLRGAGRGGLLVDRPHLLADGRWRVFLSRPVSDAGEHDEVLLLALDPAYFSREFVGFLPLTREQGVVSLLRREDGRVLSRSHRLDQVMGRQAGGEWAGPGRLQPFEAVSGVDGVARYYGVAELQQYPLGVSYGIERDELLGALVERQQLERQRTAWLLAGCMAAALLVALLTWKLLRQRSMLASILDVLPAGVLVTDLQGRVVECNAAAEELFGPREALLAGARPPGLRIVDSSGQLLAREALPCQRVLAGEAAVRCEELGLVGPRGVRWVTVSARRSADPRYGVVMAVLDQTQRHEDLWRIAESEHQLAQAQAVARLGSWRMGEDGRAMDCSAEARSILAWPAGQAFDRQALLDLLDPAGREALLAGWARLGAGRRLDMDAVLHTRAGQRWCRLMLRHESDPRSRRACVLGTVQDVTERHRMEEALQESRGHLRQLFEAYDLPMLLVDPEHEVLSDANAAAARFYGYPRERLAGMAVVRLAATPGSEERLRAGLVRTVHRLAGGEARSVEVYSSPVLTDGRPQLIAIVHDVSARVQAEQALRESESRFALALDAVHIGIWELKPDGRLFLDPRCLAMQGDGGEPAWGDLEAWMGRVFAEDRGELEAALQALAGGAPMELEFRLRHRAGHWLRVHCRGRAMDDGAGARVLGTWVDVSDRVHAELRNRALLGNSGIAFIIVSPDQRILQANRQAHLMFSPDGAPLIGRSMRTLHLDDARYEEFDQECRQIRRQGCVAREFPLRAAGGEPRWCYLSGVLVDPDLPSCEVIWAVIDVAERHAAQEALMMSEERLAAVISHFPDPLMVEDAGGHVTMLNALFHERFSIPAGESALVGLPRGEVCSRVARVCADPQRFLRAIAELEQRAHPSGGASFALASGEVLGVDHVPIFRQRELLGRLWIFRGREPIRVGSELAIIAGSDLDVPARLLRILEQQWLAGIDQALLLAVSLQLPRGLPPALHGRLGRRIVEAVQGIQGGAHLVGWWREDTCLLCLPAPAPAVVEAIRQALLCNLTRGPVISEHGKVFWPEVEVMSRPVPLPCDAVESLEIWLSGTAREGDAGSRHALSV